MFKTHVDDRNQDSGFLWAGREGLVIDRRETQGSLPGGGSVLHVGQRSAHFFHKGQYNQCFRLCEPESSSHNYSTLLL